MRFMTILIDIHIYFYTKMLYYAISFFEDIEARFLCSKNLIKRMIRNGYLKLYLHLSLVSQN